MMDTNHSRYAMTYNSGRRHPPQGDRPQGGLGAIRMADQHRPREALDANPLPIEARRAAIMGMDARPEHPQAEPQPAADKVSEADNAPCFDSVPIHDLGHADVPAPEYIVGRILPTGVPTLLGGHGGTGKFLLALVLAVFVAAGRDFMGLLLRRVQVRGAA